MGRRVRGKLQPGQFAADSIHGYQLEDRYKVLNFEPLIEAEFREYYLARNSSQIRVALFLGLLPVCPKTTMDWIFPSKRVMSACIVLPGPRVTLDCAEVACLFTLMLQCASIIVCMEHQLDSSSVEEGNPDMQRTLIVFVTAIAAGCAANSPPQTVESSNTEILKSAPDKGHKTDSLELYNASVPEKERIICRNEPITGTHMYRKRCYTVAHKDAMESHSKDWLRTRGTSGSAQKVVDPEDPRLGK